MLQDIVRTVCGAAGAALGGGVTRYCEDCVGAAGAALGGGVIRYCEDCVGAAGAALRGGVTRYCENNILCRTIIYLI